MGKARGFPTLLWASAAVFCAVFLLLVVLALRGGRRSDADLLAVRPPVKLPSPNAFPVYVAAANAVADTSYDKLLPGDSPPHRNDPALKRYATLAAKDALLRRNAPALKKLREGFTLAYREPPAPPTFDAKFPYYARYRDLARLLAFESELKAAHGDTAGAVQSNLDAVRLGWRPSAGAR